MIDIAAMPLPFKARAVISLACFVVAILVLLVDAREKPGEHHFYRLGKVDPLRMAFYRPNGTMRPSAKWVLFLALVGASVAVWWV